MPQALGNIIVLALVGLAVYGALRQTLKKDKGCCGSCSGCSGCAGCQSARACKEGE